MNSLNNNLPILIFILLIIIYILFGYGVTISNDSVTNIEQITALDLWSRSSHFSFHLFGIIFYLIFSKLIGLSAVKSIEIMLAIFSAAASAALYQIVLKKFNDINQAIITVIIYAFTSGVFRFSCQVEYLILVPSLCILSLYFYAKEQYLIAGIIFGFGMLTSLLSLLFIPTFLIFTSIKEIFNKHNVLFLLFALTIFVAVNIFTYQETISGHWSYGNELEYYKKIINKIKLLRHIAIFIYGYLRSFNIIIFNLPLILIYLFRMNKKFFYILIITFFIHLLFAIPIPEGRYGGYQMTAYPILSISSGYFLSNLFKKRKNIAILIIIFYLMVNIFIFLSERSYFQSLKETYIQMNNNLKKKSVLIVYQAVKPIKRVYGPNLQIYNILSDYQNELAKLDGYVPIDLEEVVNKNDTIYVLESGVSMPDEYLKVFFSQFTKNQGAKVKGFALEKILTIDPSLKKEKLRDYPIDVYKLTRDK